MVASLIVAFIARGGGEIGWFGVTETHNDNIDSCDLVSTRSTIPTDDDDDEER